jgi:hypothetical protein
MQTFSQFCESKATLYSYSSVLFLLPEKEAQKIHDWGLKNVPDKDLYHGGENDRSYGREDEMHCTVLYGIHDKRSVSARNLLSDVKPFEIKLGKITSFTNPEKFDVLKVEVDSAALHKVHNLLRDNLETTESYPLYKPHITIAYLKKGKAKDLIGSQEFLGTTIGVEKLVFSSRAGIKSPIRLSK